MIYRIPGIKPFILLLLVPIVFSTTARAAHYTAPAKAGACNLTNKGAGRLLVAR